MPYSQMFKHKMIQKMIGSDAISATALSKQIDVPQTTLSTWLRKRRNQFMLCRCKPTQWKYDHGPENAQWLERRRKTQDGP